MLLKGIKKSMLKNNLPQKLAEKLLKRRNDNAFREINAQQKGIDFSSNDYLGFSKLKQIHQVSFDLEIENYGATGSRLLTGNNHLYLETERLIAGFLEMESALIYPSGYMANVGLLSAILQRSDVVLYDELCHASIKDGIRLSFAQSFSYKHNNIEDLQNKLNKIHKEASVYVVTESVFSMDGDIAPLEELVQLFQKNQFLIVDEAHAVGVLGEKGEGLVSMLNLNDKVFAKIVTFGKAFGVHGAAVLGTNELKDYLINFSRPFIYTTGLPYHTLFAIKSACEHLQSHPEYIRELKQKINSYSEYLTQLQHRNAFSANNSAIQYVKINGNDKTKKIAEQLNANGFDVRPILSPTVKKGEERLRICLHVYNTDVQIFNLLTSIDKLLTV
jgi:8-amino-7-oxononanoate synthase